MIETSELTETRQSEWITKARLQADAAELARLREENEQLRVELAEAQAGSNLVHDVLLRMHDALTTEIGVLRDSDFGWDGQFGLYVRETARRLSNIEAISANIVEILPANRGAELLRANTCLRRELVQVQDTNRRMLADLANADARAQQWHDNAMELRRELMQARKAPWLRARGRARSWRNGEGTGE